MKDLKKTRLVAIAGFTLMLSLTAFDAEAQNRGNKGGEMRGKERAAQVKQMNDEKKNMENKAKKAKKEKMMKKGKK